MPLERVTVIGAGAWGTALAQAAASAGRTVTLVARDPAVVETINTRHRNPAYLGPNWPACTLGRSCSCFCR